MRIHANKNRNTKPDYYHGNEERRVLAGIFD